MIVEPSPQQGIKQQFSDEYPFESHYLEIDGHRYHYIDEGSGEPLLMVHGNPTWSFIWRDLVKDLSRDYRVLAVDHIGCGLSDKPADYQYVLNRHIENLGRLVTSLDLTGVTLLAHDWGGAIGMGAAVRMPERFSRFVLLNTAAFRSTRVPRRIAVCRVPLLGALGVRGMNLFVQAAIVQAVEKKDRMTPEVKAGYLAPYDSWANRIAVHRFVQDIPLNTQHVSYQTLVDVEQGLGQFRESPMLLIWGERDWCFTLEFLKEFQQRFPQAETCTFADAGHYVLEDAHERIIPRVRTFLEGA